MHADCVLVLYNPSFNIAVILGNQGMFLFQLSIASSLAIVTHFVPGELMLSNQKHATLVHFDACFPTKKRNLLLFRDVEHFCGG